MDIAEMGLDLTDFNGFFAGRAPYKCSKVAIFLYSVQTKKQMPIIFSFKQA